MKIPINLASQPFRRDRPILIASGLLAVALLGLLAALISLNLMQRNQQAATRHEIDRLQSQIRALSAQQTQQEAVLRKPENSEVLERSLFLNSLLYRKGISWTKIFADLEKTLPHNVRVISIRPTVNAQNQISLDMTVGTETPEPMIGLLKSLESSPLFNGVSLHSSRTPSQSEPLYQYRLSVNYAQKL